MLTCAGDIPGRVGVYGTDGSGELVIPTIYAQVGRIHRGAEPGGIEPTPQTASLTDQLLAAAGSASGAAAEARDAAAAAREAAAACVDPTALLSDGLKQALCNWPKRPPTSTTRARSITRRSTTRSTRRGPPPVSRRCTRRAARSGATTAWTASRQVSPSPPSYADGSSAVIDPADYTLSGSLDAAESTVAVTYAGKTAAFSVTVTPVGDTEYASNVRNFRLSSESGSSGMGADYFWLKCTGSSMISSYTSWAFDSKKTLWDTVKGKRLRVRASLMSPDWTGEAWEKNCIMASFGIFSSAGITGGSGRQKWHRFGNIYDLPGEYTTYEFVLDATLENMDAGTGTPTASSTCGLILYSQTLNELRCNAVSVREVLST